MWFKNLLGHSKSENSSSVAAANPTLPGAADIENPPTKANAQRQEPAHRQPLAAVVNHAADHHQRAPDVQELKPAKAARMETMTEAHPQAPAQAPLPLGYAAKPSMSETVASALTGPYTHPLPDLEARRRELGPCPADIDSQDVSDPMFCSEYVQEVYDYLRKKEVEDQIDPNYMLRQVGVSSRMRMVLVDWMVEVQLKFRMTAETLYLSVNIVDKYLQRKLISREKLQLLGVTALHIASKFEEIYSIDINDFVFICDNACTAADIIAFESEVLRTIHWSLTTPYPLHFLRRYSKAAGNDGLRHTMSKYLLELSLGYYQMLKYLPSTQAAASVLLARHLLGTPPFWPESVQYHSCYKEAEILECARAMLDLVLHPEPKYRLVTRKYSGSKFCCVARTAAENAPKVVL